MLIYIIGTHWKTTGTLWYHWTGYTGITMARAVTQWSSSDNPELICIIGAHWRTSGTTSTLRCHWNHTGCAITPWISSDNPLTCCSGFYHSLSWWAKYKALGPIVATKPSGFAVGFCGGPCVIYFAHYGTPWFKPIAIWFRHIIYPYVGIRYHNIVHINYKYSAFHKSEYS